jgi:hypothetical protein
VQVIGAHAADFVWRASGNTAVRYGESFMRVIPQVVEEL